MTICQGDGGSLREDLLLRLRTPEVANLLHLYQGWVLSYPLGVYGGKKGGRRPGGASSPGEDLQTPGLWHLCRIWRVTGNLIRTSTPGVCRVPDRASSGEGGLPWVEAPPPGGKIPQEPGCVPGTPLPLTGCPKLPDYPSTTPPVSLPSGAWNMDYRSLQTHILRDFARNFQKMDFVRVRLGAWSGKSTPGEIRPP